MENGGLKAVWLGTGRVFLGRESNNGLAPSKHHVLLQPIIVTYRISMSRVVEPTIFTWPTILISSHCSSLLLPPASNLRGHDAQYTVPSGSEF